MSGPAMTTVNCENYNCRKAFVVRVADRNRGWGRFCCKSCKAFAQLNAIVAPPAPKPKKKKKPGPPGGTPSKKPPKPSMRDNPKPESFGEWS